MLDVKMIAATEVREEIFSSLEICDLSYLASSPEHLSEFAGRGCYQSWHRPNPETARTDQYVIRNILGKGHESVLEHASATFYVSGVSRSLTHELIRHRHLSFSELSQRYVDMEETDYVVPPAMDYETHVDLVSVMRRAQSAYYDIDHDLRELGYPRKQSREAARSVMPNATETRLTVTGNMRAWRHVIRLRGSLDADAEIRELAVELYRQLSNHSPAIFADMELATAEDGRDYIRHRPLTPAQFDGTKPIREQTAGEVGLTGE